MSAIGPGDWVECVDGSPHAVCGASLVAGKLYRVRDAIPDARTARGRGPTLCLVEIVLPIGVHGVEMSWALARFRPIYRPKSEIIEALKQPAPSVRETEDA